MLAGRCETSESFFDCLRMLRINGVPRERVASELESVGIDMNEMIERAKAFNRIEDFRPLVLSDI